MTFLCCTLCGKVGDPLPVEHGCVPNLPERDLEIHRQRRLEGERRTAALALIGGPSDGPGYFKDHLRLRRAGALDREGNVKPGWTPGAPVDEFRSAPAPGRLAGLVRMVAGAEKGERNARLFWSSCRAGEAVAEGVMDPWEAAKALATAAATTGLPAREIALTVASGFKTAGIVL